VESNPLFGAMDAVPVEQTANEIDRVIANTQNKQLRSNPGEVYAYSNFGYCLLGYISEKASGQLYTSLLQDYIFAVA
jgi:CubicO group peptidase (beta-lactamase class C family)